VPGATTVLNVKDKSAALMHWAWECGQKGIDFRKARDQAADIGTIAHFMIECHLDGVDWDLSDYGPADISKAETAFLKFLEFWDSHKLKKVRAEAQLVSDRYQYGGTLDLVAEDDRERLWLIDFKTSKAIYPEHVVQVVAYEKLWHENFSREIQERRILRVGKEDVGDCEVYPFVPTNEDWELFKACLHLYYANKKWPRARN
jgi:hypothetical protein